MNDKSVSLSRKEREREQHRCEIIEAAVRLFSTHGYHSVSMQQIAAEAEFATGTLYKFFPSKVALYREIMLGVVDDITSELRPVLAQDKDEKTMILEFLYARRAAFMKRIEYVKLYNMVGNGFGSSGDDVVDAVIAERRKEVDQKLHAYFVSGIEKGLFKPVNVEVLVRLLQDFSQAIIRNEALHGDLDDDDLKAIDDVFFHGILA